MSRRIYLFLASVMVAVHWGIVLVVITPVISLCIRQRPHAWVVTTTLLATVLTIVSYLFRGECLLNSLERLLRRRGGETDIYEGSFVEHYVKKIGITIPKGVISIIIVISILVSIYYVLN